KVLAGSGAMADGWRSRPGDRQAVVPGRRPVEEALEARRALKILYAAPEAGKGLGPLLQKARGIGGRGEAGAPQPGSTPSRDRRAGGTLPPSHPG
ncbi:MAG: hypothetical protein QJR00_08525, partial [Bacillota bacterium]|nr:hypothetical protein [Bacillota bacterium]